MSRRVGQCRTCPNGTRHDDRRCSRCRRSGIRVGLVSLEPTETAAPRLDQLLDSRSFRDLTPMLDARQPISWRGRGG